HFSTLPLPDAVPICTRRGAGDDEADTDVPGEGQQLRQTGQRVAARGGDQVVVVDDHVHGGAAPPAAVAQLLGGDVRGRRTALHQDRKSTRLNSSHVK